MKTLTLRFTVFLTALSLLLGSASSAYAQRRPRVSDENLRSNPKLLEAFKDVVAKPSKSVCRVKSDGKDVALGTIVDAGGLVLTRAGAVAKGKTSCEFSDGKTLDADVVATNEPHDLALLKVDAKGLTSIVWKTSKEAEPGDWISAPGLKDLPVAIGVVGVAERKLPTTGKGAFLGLGLADDVSKEGVRVEGVQPRGPAAKGGIKDGDVIISLNGKVTRDSDTLRETLNALEPGKTIELKVKRGKEETELKVTLGKRPSFSDPRDELMQAMGSKLSERRNGFPNVLQHDAVIRPEDCGGPLVTLDGKAVGINVSRAGRTETYAIPSDTVQALIKDMLAVNKK